MKEESKQASRMQQRNRVLGGATYIHELIATNNYTFAATHRLAYRKDRIKACRWADHKPPPPAEGKCLQQLINQYEQTNKKQPLRHVAAI